LLRESSPDPLSASVEAFSMIVESSTNARID
jgi:hypothetical protein